MNTDELGPLLPSGSGNGSGMKKKPSFYGIRSHLKKFYELSFSSESPEPSPSAIYDPFNQKSSHKNKWVSNSLVKCICRLCILTGSIAILVGVCLLIAVFSTPLEAPILSENAQFETIDKTNLRHNNQLAALQTVGIYLLLAGAILLLLSTLIAIIYLITISCCATSKADGSGGNGGLGFNGHRKQPYVYDRGEF